MRKQPCQIISFDTAPARSSPTARLNGRTASLTGLSRAFIYPFTPHTPKCATGRLTALRYANCSCQDSHASLYCAGHLAEGAGSLTECNYRLLIRELWANYREAPISTAPL